MTDTEMRTEAIHIFLHIKNVKAIIAVHIKLLFRCCTKIFIYTSEHAIIILT